MKWTRYEKSTLVLSSKTELSSKQAIGIGFVFKLGAVTSDTRNAASI